MHPRFLWILVLGAAVAAVAVGAFALERTGVIGSGGSPTPPAQKQFSDNAFEENDIEGVLKPDNHEGSNQTSTGDENEADENEGGSGPAANENEPDKNEGARGPRANENEPDENDRGG
jgi:hypothetical protein